MITQAELVKLLNYDPTTGVFKWRRGGRKRKSETAGYLSNGYIRIYIKGKEYGAHRLAWLYVYGVWPTHVIDHIYGNRADNRIAHLRDVTHAVNVQGFRSISKRNKSGYTGVVWNERVQGFTASRMKDGTSKFLGVFNTAEEAADAYANADEMAAANPKQYRERRPLVQTSNKSLTQQQIPCHHATTMNANNSRNLRTRVQEYLPKLKSRDMTNRQVAVILGCSEEHLSRTLSELKFARDPAPDRKAKTSEAKLRKERIAHAAATMAPDQAAAHCGVSVRTIYRYLAKQNGTE